MRRPWLKADQNHFQCHWWCSDRYRPRRCANRARHAYGLCYVHQPRAWEGINDSEAAAAYVLDRAGQYSNSSPILVALEDIAVALANGEHLVAKQHGELDDLAKRVRRLRRTG